MWQEAGETPFENVPNAKGDEVQKLNVIHSLPNLLAGDATSCIKQVLPRMQQSLSTASIEFHIAASATFKTILEEKLVSSAVFTQIFLNSILTSVDSKEDDISRAWLRTLLDVIELLPLDVIREKILPIAVNKGQISQSITSRIMCCKLIGKICTRFDSISIKKEVLPTVHSLCQDVRSEVRACICFQLRYVAEGLDAESFKQSLLPSLVELASDEYQTVRETSVQTIASLLPQLQQDTIINTIAPLIRKLCENAIHKSEDRVICVISEEFGRIALGLEKHLTLAEKTWVIKYFQQLAKMGLTSVNKDDTNQEMFYSSNPYVIEEHVKCRKHCAYNIPALFIFAANASETVSVLLPTFSNLASDPYFLVRKNIGSCIHEVASVLGPECGLIQGDLIKLLRDDAEVLQDLIPNLAQILELLMHNQIIGTEQVDVNIREIGKALLKCENAVAITNNWRLAAVMLEQLEILPKCFSSDFIFTYFVPMIMMRILTARPLPVRSAACKTILVYLRCNVKAQQRADLRNRIHTDIRKNTNFYMRMSFMRMMVDAMAMFSSAYMKEHFYASLLSMHEDPVANIRLKLVTMLPTMKRCIQLPTDKKILTTLEAAVRNLINNEKDRDVTAALTEAVAELDEIEVAHEGQTPGKPSKADMEDAKKREEEKKLASGKPLNGGKPSISHQSAAVTSSPSKKQITPPKLASSPIVAGLSAAKPVRQNQTSFYSSTESDLQSTSRHVAGSSATIDQRKAALTRQTPPLRHDISKASTSSTDLTTNWARLTSNSMLLTNHPWESMRPSESENLPRLGAPCSCYESLDLIFRTRMFMSSEQLPCCSRFGDEHPRTKPPLLHSRPDYGGRPLTHTYEDRRSALQNFLLTRASLVGDQVLSQQHSASYADPYWAFSSMPEIPVTLLDDEFIVDAGIRMPSQLASSPSTCKIPNLQDIVYRNRRLNLTNNYDKNRRSSAFNGVRWSTKRYSMEYEDCIKQKSNGNFSTSGRDSVDYEEGMRRHGQGQVKQQFLAQDSRFRRYPGFVGKPQENDRTKRHSLNVEKDRMADKIQSSNSNDRTKRHSMNLGVKLPPEPKDSRQRFKRYSMEVPNYVLERGPRVLKRFSTLDVNHNQGTSKIPLRSGQSSGSRTAPSTRASSPVRTEARMLFEMNKDDDGQGQLLPGGRLSMRFSSSDEEIDKLCQNFMNRSTSLKEKESRLPVRTQRKKM